MNLDDAPVIGRIGARPDNLDAPFWEALAENTLKLPRCEGCRTWVWPVQPICPSCHRPGLGWEEVEARGRIYTWTRTHQPFAPEFADLVPYLTVVVELAGADNRRLAGILLGDQSLDPRIGDEVVGVVKPASELTTGVPVLRWKRSVDDSPSDS